MPDRVPHWPCRTLKQGPWPSGLSGHGPKAADGGRMSVGDRIKNIALIVKQKIKQNALMGGQQKTRRRMRGCRDRRAFYSGVSVCRSRAIWAKFVSVFAATGVSETSTISSRTSRPSLMSSPDCVMMYSRMMVSSYSGWN